MGVQEEGMGVEEEFVIKQQQYEEFGLDLVHSKSSYYLHMYLT